ncbi:hypothetical protein [Aeromonas veronii]|uniref:hypothetical protein n=1 Tax=Aeromonas veronii TaxID=654 RepID=UPI002443EC79|nr:hypothetical protein [Aeromonas veronii]
MIVVAIVAILAAVALPAYQNYTKKSQDDRSCFCYRKVQNLNRGLCTNKRHCVCTCRYPKWGSCTR